MITELSRGHFETDLMGLPVLVEMEKCSDCRGTGVDQGCGYGYWGENVDGSVPRRPVTNVCRTCSGSGYFIPDP